MKNFDDKSEIMAPLWLECSYIERYSIGWRMGYGEDYSFEFRHWYSNLTMDEKLLYQEMFPEPKGWLGWYEGKDNDIYDDDRILLWNENGNPKYSLQKLQNEFRKGKNMNFLFFWGHQPSDDGRITKTCLSQWWKSDFSLEIFEYCCMEQYMMSQKARVFRDEEIFRQILKTKDPKQIKELGRKVRNFKEDVWEKKRSSVILNGNFAKFLQTEELKQFLIKTGDAVLVEASSYDRIWGIGMPVNDSNIKNPFAWKGQNLLGFALMEVRDEIIRVCKNEDKILNRKG